MMINITQLVLFDALRIHIKQQYNISEANVVVDKFDAEALVSGNFTESLFENDETRQLSIVFRVENIVMTEVIMDSSYIFTIMKSYLEAVFNNSEIEIIETFDLKSPSETVLTTLIFFINPKTKK